MTSLSPFRDGDQALARQEKAERIVLTIESVGPKPDPTYRTVLVRLRLADDSFLEFEVSSVDAQRLGHALNTAGGGSLAEAVELRKTLRLAVEAMELVPFGHTVECEWGADFTQQLVKAREVLARG